MIHEEGEWWVSTRRNPIAIMEEAEPLRLAMDAIDRSVHEWETAIARPEHGPNSAPCFGHKYGLVVVERYGDEAQAVNGHAKWIALMQKNPNRDDLEAS